MPSCTTSLQGSVVCRLGRNGAQWVSNCRLTVSPTRVRSGSSRRSPSGVEGSTPEVLPQADGAGVGASAGIGGWGAGGPGRCWLKFASGPCVWDASWALISLIVCSIAVVMSAWSDFAKNHPRSWSRSVRFILPLRHLTIIFFALVILDRLCKSAGESLSSSCDRKRIIRCAALFMLSLISLRPAGGMVGSSAIMPFRLVPNTTSSTFLNSSDEG